MGYGRTVLIDDPVAEAVPKVKEALKAQGFGTLTEIDVQATLKEKIDAEVDPYVILGACNPRLAHRPRLVPDELEDPAPGRVAERVEHLRRRCVSHHLR